MPALAAAAFLALLSLDAGQWGPLQAADTAISAAFRGYGERHPDLIAVVRVATDIAVTWLYLAAGAVATLVLHARRRRRDALFTGAVTAVIPILWSLMHLWLHSPRPTGGFVEVHTNGFPSGHTSNAAAAALAAALLLWPRLRPRGRVLLAVLATAFALFVGLTRVMLLAHWPTDVVGGWLLALAVVPPLALLTRLPDRSGAVAR
ncbi:phosphatase PAP2 family protein [Spirilliplanes yamanashiensis]|uniref:phosphatase PAP2 family protein n=1 Tax=Spirilliplanes yamanashiensis TaxID=42233 RepID=UPI00194FA67C|nr:phosphatase PAP2 family protein [Spirilliplanes yamanashiensis]MDP9816635.1 undecaprenyl-diphosphatase [Spirilliplanes yamanashiensis]